MITRQRASTVMEGPEGRPLLVLDRPGEGRIAMLASDHAWLWSRGYEGGGPQRELLRRLAHWLMQEPELEEETLVAEPLGRDDDSDPPDTRGGCRIGAADRPDGSVAEIEMTEVAPGEWRGEAEVGAHGIYRLAEGGIVPSDSRWSGSTEGVREPISQADALEPLAGASDGAIRRLEGQGLPVSAARGLAGRPPGDPGSDCHGAMPMTSTKSA